MASITMREGSLVLLVGAAGSGKSTLARTHFGADEILSSDALRAVVSGAEGDQTASAAAFRILHRELGRRLGAQRLTVVDATNVRAAHRRPLIALARQAGASMAAIVLDLPTVVVRSRNASRDRVVDPTVLARQARWLHETIDGDQLVAEGFDPVLVLRTEAAVDALEVTRRSPDHPA